MKYYEFGECSLPTIILLHGGGLSGWSYNEIVAGLKERYHMVIPIIDGHGEEGNTEFESIEVTADRLIAYIDRVHGGKVFAIGGLSIGAQITVEVLSKRVDIAEFAIIESALVYPMRGTRSVLVPMMKLSYGMIKQKWFAKTQAKTLFVPDHLFEQYYEDSMGMTKQSLVNMTLSNGCYSLKPTLAETQAKVLVIVGEKELALMKKSARRLIEVIVRSQLYIGKNMGHGELSLKNPSQYIEQLENLFAQEN